MKTRNSIGRHPAPVGVVLTVAVALFPGVLFGQGATRSPLRDFQVWSSFRATHPLRRRRDFFIAAGLRYGNDQGHMTYRRITTGFDFHWQRILTIQPYYQYSMSDSYSGSLDPENRLGIALTLGVPWRHWQVSDRNVGERRFLVNKQAWRYRNRLEFRRPISMVREHLSVFAWDEVYFGSRAGRWYRNRVALGAGRRLIDKVSVDVFYVHQNDGFSPPDDLNGVGMALKTQF